MTLGQMYRRKPGQIWVVPEDKKSEYVKAMEQQREFIRQELQKKKEMLPLATPWMDSESIMLSEISQS